MGLGTVELVMRIEEEFRIAIPDNEASLIETMGALHVCVMRLLRDRGKSPNVDVVWERLRSIVSDETGFPKDQIGRPTHILRDLALD